MTRAEILVLLGSTDSNGGLSTTTQGVVLSFLPDNPLVISFEAEEFDHEVVATLVSNLCEIPKSFHKQATKAVYEACLQSFEVLCYDFDTPQDQLDFEREQSGAFPQAKTPSSEEEIWPLVKFEEILISRGMSGPSNGKTVAIVSGDCAWDGEHGVGMVFVEGKTFVSVEGATG